MVAFATKSVRPKISVLSAPPRRIVYELEGGAELEFTALAFSACGTRLVSVSTLPDYKLT